MENIPASPAEVKSIIEAVNLKTHTRFTYLKGDHGVCKFPFKISPDGFKDLLFTKDGLMFDGADPDTYIALTEPPEVPPGDPLYAGDPTLYFKRPLRPGEVNNGHLVALQARARAEANPGKTQPAEKPRPAPRRDNVVPIGEIIPDIIPTTPATPDVVKLLRSVGRELKLAWLPADLYESDSFQKLKLGEQELYRIYRTYSKQAGGESKNSYVRMGISQAGGLLERRKKDMIGSSNHGSRKVAEKIGTYKSSIKRYSLTLQKAGWIKKIVRGRPPEGRPYVNKYLVVKSEKQRFRAVVKKKKKVVH